MDLGKIEKETRYEPIEEPVPQKEDKPIQQPEKEPVPA